MSEGLSNVLSLNSVDYLEEAFIAKICMPSLGFNAKNYPSTH